MPDYPSRARKEPVAMIRMTTRTGCRDRGFADQDSLLSRVDPCKYLGSNISLTDSLTSTLRLTSPQFSKPSDPLLLAITEKQQIEVFTRPLNGSAVWGSSSGRTLGTPRTAPSTQQSARRVQRPTSAEALPLISTTQPGKIRYPTDNDYDADVTFVDPDLVLDQGSELVLRGLVEAHSRETLVDTPTRYTPPTTDIPSRCTDRDRDTAARTPPVPTADYLSRRQLKLLGTSVDGGSASKSAVVVDRALSQLIMAEEPVDSRSKAAITPTDLVDLASGVGERMMVNRAKLLLLQHSIESYTEAGMLAGYSSPKPPSAPAGVPRPSPLPSMNTADSRTSLAYGRASTAPSGRQLYRKSYRSSKLRSSSGVGGWSVPSATDCRANASDLMNTFTVQSLIPAYNKSVSSKGSLYLPPPPSESPYSSNTTLGGEIRELATTPHLERCTNYKDPKTLDLGLTRGYSPLKGEESLSETPLLQATFSSLSSFLPSTQDLIND